MVSLDWNRVNAWRLARHSLLHRADRREPLAVVSRVCGLHAQVMSAAELSLLARIDGLDNDFVENALWQERSLVKTWALRGTLHLLPSSELPTYSAALDHSVSIFYRKGAWLRYHGVTLDELNALLDAVRNTLSETPITRQDLATAVAEHTGIAKLGELLLSGWGALLKPSALRGDLCFGPNQGQNVTFVRTDRWLSGWAPVDPEEAVQAVARRFLGAYAPASLEDFERWMGLTPAAAKRIFKSLGDEIAPVEVEGWAAWALASTVAEMAACEQVHVVRLLPYFDPYTVEIYRHNRFLLATEHEAQVYRPQGWISPVVLVDGRIGGVWDHEKKRSELAVKVEIFSPLPSEVRDAIRAEADRLAAYFNLDLHLQGV